MATITDTMDDQCWLEVAPIIEGLSGQARALADAGCGEAELVSGLERASRQLQETVHFRRPRQQDELRTVDSSVKLFGRNKGQSI